MGLREKMNQNPKIAGAVLGALLLTAGAVTVASMVDFHIGEGKIPDGSKAFFTVDDGKTWFAAERDKVPPFKYEGKDAVRCYVVEMNGKTFVSYMERYTETGRKAAEELNKSVGIPDGRKIKLRDFDGRELKRPGDAAWTPVPQLGSEGKFINEKLPKSSEPPKAVLP